MFDRLFPLGIAEGKSFLGRKKEIERLKNNVTRGTHTLLLSPRRYGKTSLAKYVVNSIHYPWVEIDFFIAQNEFSIEQKFLKAVQSILSQIDAPERWINPLMMFFKNLNKTWTVGVKGVKLELTPENHKDVPENILDALNALEHVLSKNKQHAVLYIDEFQEITYIKINRAIEGAIRHFAQESKHVVFIFSGSNRNMLKHMFGNKSRPLYALCDEINLDRLSPNDYRPYLNKIATETWSETLDDTVFNKIIDITDCHPRYIYNICMCLWEHCTPQKKSPTITEVNDVWSMMINDHLKDIREILAKRATGQIKILSLISLGYNKEITGQLAQSKLGMSGSAIVQSLKILEHDDYIEKLKDSSYRIIDPLLKATLIEYGSDYFR